MTGGSGVGTNTRSDKKDFDILDLAAFQDWKNGAAEDNHLRLERLLRNLETALSEELTVRQRQMICMRYFNQKKVTEIADELGLAKSTVSRTISTAVDKLFKALRYSL